MTELQDLDGVGPARAESMEEEDYDMESLAEADPEQLAEDISVPEDTALEFVVQAQNVLEEDEDEEELEGDEFDLQPKDVAEEVDEDEEKLDEEALEEEVEELEEEIEEEMEGEDEHEPEGREMYDVTVEFPEEMHYHVFHAAIMRHHEDIYTGNEVAKQAMDRILDNINSFEEVNYRVDERGLNEMHSAVTQQTTRYQGENLIDHMDALNDVLDQINEQRKEYLF